MGVVSGMRSAVHVLKITCELIKGKSSVHCTWVVHAFTVTCEQSLIQGCDKVNGTPVSCDHFPIVNKLQGSSFYSVQSHTTKEHV